MVQQPLYLLFIFSKWYNNFLQRKSYCSSSSLFFIPSFFPLSHFHSFSPALSSLLWKKPLGSCWLPLPIRCSTLHPISIFISLSKKLISTNPFLGHITKSNRYPFTKPNRYPFLGGAPISAWGGAPKLGWVHVEIISVIFCVEIMELGGDCVWWWLLWWWLCRWWLLWGKIIILLILEREKNNIKVMWRNK